MNPALARLRLDPLLHFHAAARHRSLRRAAEALSLTPPAITRSLQKLEQDLGVVLAHRSRAGFRLTEDGERLFRAAERVVAELEGFLASPGPPERFAGLVSLGMTPHWSPDLNAALAAMRARFPESRLAVLVASSDEILRLLELGEVDLGIGPFGARGAGLRRFAVAREPFRYYVSRSHPLWSRPSIRRGDLAGEAVAWMDHERLSRAQLEGRVFRNASGQVMRTAVFSNDFEAGLRLALAGRLVVPLARSFARDWVRRGLLRELALRPRQHDLAIECVCDPTRIASPPVAFLLDALRTDPPQQRARAIRPSPRAG